MDQKRYTLADSLPRLGVTFFRLEAGVEPVREWLNALTKADRRTIGREIRLVQFGWPVGMPVVRKLDDGLWEIRVRLDKRIARVMFTVVQSRAVLVHAFIKKSRRAPATDLALARARPRRPPNFPHLWPLETPPPLM